MIAEGDRVALESTSRGMTRDGRIQHVREYMDTLYASEVFSDGLLTTDI